MRSNHKIDVYEALVKKVLRNNLQGYKRFGAMTGASLGSGIGGTVGLVDSAKKHRRGEFDQLSTKEKALEYLKGMAGKAVVGAGIGASVGTGLGELGRRYSARSAFNEGGKDSYKELFRDFRKSPGMFDKYQQDLKGAIKDLKKEPVFNIIDKTKEILKSTLSKKTAEQKDMNKQLKEYFILKTSEQSLPLVKQASLASKEFNRGVASPNYPEGLRRNGALYGGAYGGLMGGGIGALKGLISPGSKIDPDTGKEVDGDRLESALQGALSGGLIGGGVGAAGGAHMGSLMRNSMKGSRGKLLASMSDFKNFPKLVPSYLKRLIGRK